ncbi:endoplasmic reticulum junction formation protein lunapark-B isoform X2 [Silurus meridionalis]|uniref:endoplasmic reticulum junction formation protein lunapark-B isoform X2 n=1 Tax=Silurus meridionalis TaxID=175797 RepID=UPI001EEACD71|nr:endoplasmic reticulum junction formation protein lunapark-B isoform X2 [Silurus meridionalis]
MGAFISRWKAKPPTVELLEDLDKEIKDLEEFRGKNQRMQKIWVGRLLFYSAALYLFTCLFVYYLYLPAEWSGRIVTALPLIAFPALVWFARKLLIILFSKRTERNNEKLEDLKSAKRKILEEVMETETYKNAKLILERFDPESKSKAEAEATPARPQMTPKPGQEVRLRHIAMATPGPRPTPPGATPLRTAPGGPPENITGASVSSPALSSGMQTPPPIRRSMSPYSPVLGTGPPIARPILPRERSAVDRVIEYLVGDGPQNRYALICQQCFSHNGMALKEEFEFLAFRCAYCYFMNPARKTRPQAPRLPEFNFERRLRSESPEPQSSAASNTPEDSDAHEESVMSSPRPHSSLGVTPWSKVHSFSQDHTENVEPPACADKPEPEQDKEEAPPTSDGTAESPAPSKDGEPEAQI